MTIGCFQVGSWNHPTWIQLFIHPVRLTWNLRKKQKKTGKGKSSEPNHHFQVLCISMYFLCSSSGVYFPNYKWLFRPSNFAMLHKLLHHIAQANGCKLSIIAHTTQAHRVRELVKPRCSLLEISMWISWSTFFAGGTQRKIQERKTKKTNSQNHMHISFCALHAEREREKQNLDFSSCRGISYILQTNKFIFIHMYQMYWNVSLISLQTSLPRMMSVVCGVCVWDRRFCNQASIAESSRTSWVMHLIPLADCWLRGWSSRVCSRKISSPIPNSSTQYHWLR